MRDHPRLRQAMLAEVARRTGCNIRVAAQMTDLVSALKLPMHDAVTIARQLSAKGWIAYEGNDDGGYTVITIQGVEEAERMERPFLQRWPHEHPFLYAAMTSLATAIIVLFGNRLLESLFKTMGW
jgi:hypothetical protein